MAKKYREIGSVVKSKVGEDGKPTGGDYIKIREDVVLKKGQILKLESKDDQLRKLNQSIANGKVSESLGATIKERLDQFPSFVRFSIIAVTEE